jgi:hypothetical protein
LLTFLSVSFFHGIYFILLVVDDAAIVFGVEVMPTAEEKLGDFFRQKHHNIQSVLILTPYLSLNPCKKINSGP